MCETCANKSFFLNYCVLGILPRGFQPGRFLGVRSVKARKLLISNNNRIESSRRFEDKQHDVW
jgi:hypothetical protein